MNRSGKGQPPKDDMPWLYPLGFIVVGLLWVWLFVFETPHWVSAGLGFMSGGLLMAWAVEITGNKFLSSHSEKPGETPPE